ncbi:hypothetical protein PR048_017700 [Dryococelus australis]|uniref:Uncharacterized protein n=1 Tax=Dryococelus australis TaxID=614101 RepID=A0ABQ9HAI0_9NEOP|nr:hypothetical protein PR048_017700 [Dryococelus australis]
MAPLCEHLTVSFRFSAGSIPYFRSWESYRDDAAVRRVFSRISRFPRRCIPALLHTHIASTIFGSHSPDINSHPNIFSPTLAYSEYRFSKIDSRALVQIRTNNFARESYFQFELAYTNCGRIRAVAGMSNKPTLFWTIFCQGKIHLPDVRYRINFDKRREKWSVVSGNLFAPILELRGTAQKANSTCCSTERREVRIKQCQNARTGKREIPEKTRGPAASADTIPTCENLGVTRPGIDPTCLDIGGPGTPSRLSSGGSCLAVGQRQAQLQSSARAKYSRREAEVFSEVRMKQRQNFMAWEGRSTLRKHISQQQRPPCSRRAKMYFPDMNLFAGACVWVGSESCIRLLPPTIHFPSPLAHNFTMSGLKSYVQSSPTRAVGRRDKRVAQSRQRSRTTHGVGRRRR